MIVCSNCKHEIDNSVNRPKFCDECGASLSQGASSEGGTLAYEADREPSGENESAYFEMAREAWVDGKITVDEAQELVNEGQGLGISESRAEQLREKAIESLRPATNADDFARENGGQTSHGLLLSFNTNQFFMEGFRGVVELKLENLSNEPFDNVKVEVSSDLLSRTASWSCQMDPCKSLTKMFRVMPDAAGIELIQFRVIACQEEAVYAFWAEMDLPVFENTQDLRQISIQADKLIDIGSVTENSKNMGNSIKSHIDSLVSMDKIKNANDLMQEYRRMPKRYEILSLEFDPDRSEELRQSRQQRSETPQGKILLEADRGSLTESACLVLSSAKRRTQILVLAKPDISLGIKKHPGNDIVTRILPRNFCDRLKSDPAKGCDRASCHDCMTKRISRQHCRIQLTDEGIAVRDSKSARGTVLNGKKVGNTAAYLDKGKNALVLAEVFKVKGHMHRSHAIDEKAYAQVIKEEFGGMWDTASSLGLNALTLMRTTNLGSEDEHGSESYCLVYRAATIGSNEKCALSFPERGLESLHAILFYLGRRFYIENLTDLTNVSVNEKTLAKDQIMPLSFGDRIRIARLDMEFKQRAQLYVDG